MNGTVITYAWMFFSMRAPLIPSSVPNVGRLAKQLVDERKN